MVLALIGGAFAFAGLVAGDMTATIIGCFLVVVGALLEFAWEIK